MVGNMYVELRPTFENERGQWVVAIPEPYFKLIRKRCECGKLFWTMEGYKGHFALRHIIDPKLKFHV